MVTGPLGNRPATTHVPGAFTTPGGVELFEQRWTLSQPKGHVLIVHGYAEHSARYRHIAERLNGEGYSVYAYDQRGHGNSPGRMGYIPSFACLIADVEAFRAHVFPQMPAEPLFVWGHSMGGLVVTAWALKHRPNVRGLVLTSPAVKAADNTAPIMQKFAPLIARVAPHLPALQLDAKAISRVPEVVERYESDPLVYQGHMGVRTGYELMRTIEFVQAHLAELTLPFIVLHGTDDRLVPFAAAELLYECAGSSDKTLKRYDGGYHELFNDLGAETFFTDLLGWLKARS